MRIALISVGFVSMMACGGNEPAPKQSTNSAPQATTEKSAAPKTAAAPDRTAEIQAIAADAYVWGYPLVLIERTRRTMTNLAHVPQNTFAHKSRLATPEDNDPLPNNDVLLSSAWVDAKAEPVVLKVPEMGSRFYSIELIDMWGNPFAHITKRANGSKAATYVITAPGSSTTIPAGSKEIKAPTSSIWILARTQVDGEADVNKLLGTLKQMTLTTLSGTMPSMPPAPEARPQDIKFAGAAFYYELGQDLAAYRISGQDEMMARLSKIGIAPNLPATENEWSKAMSNQETLALSDGQKQGEQAISDRYEKLPKRKNGWDIDSGFGKWGTDFLARAAYAKRGFDQDVAEELFTPMTNTDDSDQVMSGAHDYVLHFDKNKTPPVDAFWTLALYSAKTGAIVANPKKRYAIGERTGIKRGADGSIDLFIQPEAPKGGDSNWLPSPKQDAFIVMLRMVSPKADAVSGTFEIPPVKRVR